MGGSQRAGPHSPRGAGVHCTVTACLVLTRQVNSIPPLLASSFFSSSFLFSPSSLFFHPPSPCSAFLLPRLPLCCRREFLSASNSRQLFLYTVKHGVGFARRVAFLPVSSRLSRNPEDSGSSRRGSRVASPREGCWPTCLARRESQE